MLYYIYNKKKSKGKISLFRLYEDRLFVPNESLLKDLEDLLVNDQHLIISNLNSSCNCLEEVGNQEGWDE